MRINSDITEAQVRLAMQIGQFGLALSGAFSLLNAALGNTSGRNKRAMKSAIRDNIAVFSAGWTGSRTVITGSLNLMYRSRDGAPRLTPIEDILYDIRCELHHGASVECVVINDTAGGISLTDGRVELPVGIVLMVGGIPGVFKKSGDSV